MNENEEFKFKESVKYQGILIIVMPDEIPETMWAKNNKNKFNLFFIYKHKFD